MRTSMAYTGLGRKRDLRTAGRSQKQSKLIYEELAEDLAIQWNLPYPDLFYPGTSVVWTAQINYVVCSLFAVMMFWLHKSTRRGTMNAL